jgi:phosphoribosylaminoimidazole-succinocarboxamide synthase
MGELQKGNLLAKGKTKELYEVLGDDSLLIIESKDDITKNDNPEETRQMESKAKYSTATTCGVFELLKAAGIPVAFERQISDTEFLASNCKMIMLEVIERRYAVGSYLKRHPEFEKKEGEEPHRFGELYFEIFLKTTGGKILDKEGKECGKTPNDLDNGRPIDDPLISVNSSSGLWDLKHPKHPSSDVRSNLKCSVLPENILPEGISVRRIKTITTKVFLALEEAWSKLGLRLIDFKIEFGIAKDGKLMVADVIDNDSWRLRTNDWKELSKQLFRDNKDMKEIADKYAMVSELVRKFKTTK